MRQRPITIDGFEAIRTPPTALPIGWLIPLECGHWFLLNGSDWPGKTEDDYECGACAGGSGGGAAVGWVED